MHTTANNVHNKYDPALPYCIPAARRVAGTAPPSRCKLDCMRLLAQQTCRGPAPKLIPKDCSLNRSLWVRLCLGVPPLIRAGAVRRPVHRPGTGGLFPLSQFWPPRKETKLRPDKLAPPSSGASPPDSCSSGHKPHYTQHRERKRALAKNNHMGLVTSKVPFFR